MQRNRKLVGMVPVFALAFAIVFAGTVCEAVSIPEVKKGEDVFSYVKRIKGGFDHTFYQQVVGAANEYKEGDEAIGVSAEDDASRANARTLLSNTRIHDLHDNPLFVDNLQKLIWKTTDAAAYEKIKGWTLGELKAFLLSKPESDIKAVMPGLDSDVIACVVKLMSNDDLIALGQKVFNPLPGSNLGAKGYMGARIQPNSPTDHPEDIAWQVFDGWSYATGDLVLGNNPVSDSVENIAGIEETLKDLIVTFGLEQTMPWCVLAHIDKQYKSEEDYPGSTAFWFQSLAGCDQANQTFDVTIDKMMNYARMRKGKYGLYHETGQGADFTNGAGNGFDMVVHESRKYGFSRALMQEMATVVSKEKVWSHTNDVAGFIGPEIFKTREQLVRCCLEDIAMGKLHGLTLGLDICSTLHMPVSLSDLDWCIDQIMPANPAYLMALPTKNDPMLSYLTTAFQDHVRVREKFGYKVNDAMWDFFKRIEIVDEKGGYTEHFGDPVWVYYKYKLAKGDKRSKDAIYAEGKEAIGRIEARGVPIAMGHGENPWDLNPELAEKVDNLYKDAKVSIWSEFTDEFIQTIPNAVVVSTQSKDREDYIAHPATGEALSESAVASLDKLRDSWGEKAPDVQIVVSDGLNCRAIMDEGHLAPYLEAVRKEAKAAGFTVAKENIVVKSGRVRAGYAIGNVLFKKSEAQQPKVVLHVIGERPGSGHHNFSVYIAAPKAMVWTENKVDHDIVRVISGISNTAYTPDKAAAESIKIVKEMISE